MRQIIFFLIMSVTLLNTAVFAMPASEKECDTNSMEISLQHNTDENKSVDHCKTMDNCDVTMTHCQMSSGVFATLATTVQHQENTNKQIFHNIHESLVHGYFSLLNPPPISL